MDQYQHNNSTQHNEQEQAILRAIAISSSGTLAPNITSNDRQLSFQILQEFKKYNERISICLNWIQMEYPIVINILLNQNGTIKQQQQHDQQQHDQQSQQSHDVTVATKLLALEILQTYLQTGYTKATEQDRYTIRYGVIKACRLVTLQASTTTTQQQQQLHNNNSNNNSNSTGGGGTRILASKLAVLLEGLIVRDFPQRWPTLAHDLFTPIVSMNDGGLWEDLDQYQNNQNTNQNQLLPGLVGIKIVLECFRLIAEDCTDSDFNSKISTTRRNDILLGFNEISYSYFLPKFYHILEVCVPILNKSKLSLHNMNLYLLSQNRNIHQMTNEESILYHQEERIIDTISCLLYDTLRTIEIFCANLPSSWMLGNNDDNNKNNGSNNNNNSNNQNENGTATENNNNNNNPSLDFVTALLHFMRIPDANVQVKAVECIEQLTLRGKLDINQWMRLIINIPKAFQVANEILSTVEHEYRITLKKVSGEVSEDTNTNNQGTSDTITVQYEYHRALSRMLSAVISSHVSHITSDKNIMNGMGTSYMHIHTFLNLLVGMLRHPSGRIVTEQINMWTSLFRDPQLSKLSSTLLNPFIEEILICYMDHMIKIRWDDIENEIHINTSLIEVSYDDVDDYDEWMNDLRSRSSLLFKFIGVTEPVIASKVLNERLQSLLQKYGNGQPYDHINNINQQLTLKSDAVIQLEAFCQPLDNTLSGIPSWALTLSASSTTKLDNNSSSSRYPNDDNDRKRHEIAISTCASLSAMAQTLVQWQPKYLWLKFRHVTLLEGMKHYWEYDPSTLLQGVDTMIRYLGIPDEWQVPSPSQIDQNNNMEQHQQYSGEIVSLKKRSGTALVSVSKRVPQHLVPWLSQLSIATKTLLSSDVGLIPMNQMHLYEFLSCVATAVTNPHDRSHFIADVLSDAIITLESNEIQQCFISTHTLLNSFGIQQAIEHPESVTDPVNVKRVTYFYNKMFTALNRLLSVGRRCNESTRKKSVLNGISIDSLPANNSGCDFGGIGQPMFPVDEGPLSISELAINDPFTPLWPRILPPLLQIYEVTLSIWRPEHQAILMSHPIQRYAYAISDDDAYLSRNQNTKSTSGGVFGEGGTAGSVVAGTDRRDRNLIPKWSGWFNELRNTCFQMFGLLISQRVMFAPEIAHLYPRIVNVITNPMNLKSMEHRHLTQFLKHVLELMLICCPVSLYKTHLEPIAGPLFDHLRYRLEKTWAPIIENINNNNEANQWVISSTKALTSTDCASVGLIVSRGEEEWFSWYYAHVGLFVGDLDAVTSEAAVEKYRVEISRTYSDMLQAALALKGDWALVIANFNKEAEVLKRRDSATSTSVQRTYGNTTDDNTFVNADGSPRLAYQIAIDARKMLRINGLSRFLLLESEGIAGSIIVSVIQCIIYPDAYTCRRITKICHRVVEQTAWSPKYSQLLGQQMFQNAVKNLVTEPKWMVGIEWDMINVVRDIYCRLVLGQTLVGGGQGPGLQQPHVDVNNVDHYEQAKTVDQSLHGGGILEIASHYPRQTLASLPGIGYGAVQLFENQMKTKRSAKDQKDYIRDLLRIASDQFNEMKIMSSGSGNNTASSIFDRAIEEESLLHAARRPALVQDLPEKLITVSQMNKKAAQQQSSSMNHQNGPAGLAEFSL